MLNRGVEENFTDTIGDTFSNWTNASSRNMKKATPRHIIFKLLSNNGKGKKILKAVWEKRHIIYRKKYKNDKDFFLEIMEVRR